MVATLCNLHYDNMTSDVLILFVLPDVSTKSTITLFNQPWLFYRRGAAETVTREPEITIRTRY